MKHDITLPMFGLLVAWLSALLYGMNVVLTVWYMRILYNKGLAGTANRIFLTVVAVQFCLGTAFVAVCLQQAIDGFLNSPSATAYFGNQKTPAHIAEVVLYVTNNMIADCVLTWRLYIVWGKRFWMCIPFMLMITGSAVSGYMTAGQLAALTTEELLFSEAVQRWALALWSLSIATQVSATMLIAWKVWRIHIGVVGPHKSQKTMSVVWIVLESGAVLSFSHVMLLAFYVRKTTVGGIFVAMIGELDALVPTSILVRVATAAPILPREGSAPSTQYNFWQSAQRQQQGVSIELPPVGSSVNKGEFYQMTDKGIVPSPALSLSTEGQV